MQLSWRGTLFLSILLLTVGVLLLIAGPVAYVVINNGVKNGVEENVVVDSKEHDGYEGWLSNGQTKDPSLYSKFYAFNVTNLPEVLAGETPIVQEVGPYIYKQVDEKVDVVFYEEGNEVSYKWFTHYHYLPQLDGEDSAPETDLLTTVNPAYLAVLAQANGRESNLAVGMFAQFMSTTFYTLNTTFLEQALLSSIPLTISNFRFQVNIATSGQFDSLFGAGTAFPIPLPNSGAQVTDWAPTWPHGSFNSSKVTVDELFDGSSSNSLTAATSFGAWLLALEDPSMALLLQKTWGLDELTQQALSLWMLNWKNNINQLLLEENFFPATVAELAFLQWGSLALTSPASVYHLDDSVNFFIEYAGWSSFVENSDPIATFTLDETKQIFFGNGEGSVGFTHPEEVGRFLVLLQQGDFTSILQLYGFSNVQALSFYNYYQYIISQTLGAAISAGGGLWTTHSVRDFLFEYVDPLLSIVQPESSRVTVNRNYTSIEEVQALTDRYETRYTGKDDINKIQWYKVWRGKTAVTHWKGEEEVFEGSSANNFAPGIDKDDELQVFSGSLERNILITYVKDVEVHGITTFDYTIPASTFESAAKNPANERYYTSIDGLHNMTSAELLPGASGIPLFVSKPHMLEVDESVSSQVRMMTAGGQVIDGMQPNPEIHDSYIRIEPISGAAIDFRKSLQLNIELIPEMFDLFHPNTPALFLPVYYKEETSTMTSEQANSFKSTVYGFRDTALGLLVGFLVAGVLFVCLGIFLLVVGHRNRKNNKSNRFASSGSE